MGTDQDWEWNFNTESSLYRQINPHAPPVIYYVHLVLQIFDRLGFQTSFTTVVKILPVQYLRYPEPDLDWHVDH